MDILTLLGELCNHDLVTSSDVLYAGEILAVHFCEDGYAFAMYTLFKNAGAKICRGETSERACLLADDASHALLANKHGFETLDCHIVRLFRSRSKNYDHANIITHLQRLCRLVDENTRIRSQGTDNDAQKVGSSSAHEEPRRRVRIHYDEISFLLKGKGIF